VRENQKYLETKDGVKVMLADEIAHELMLPGTECYQKLKDMFSDEDIWNEDGSFDRKKLATVIFSDEKKRDTLNGIVHPAVKEEIRHMIKKEERKNTNLMIVESALLIEDHYEEICDEMWYVYVEDEIRKKRLIYARGYDAKKVDDIIAAQLPKDMFMKHCDRVIDNSDAFEETQMQLDQIIGDLD